MKEVWEKAKQLQGELKDSYLLDILNVFGDSKGVVQRVLHEADSGSKAADAATEALAEFKNRDPDSMVAANELR